MTTVAVTSDQALVAEAVRTALIGRGLTAVVVGWPGQAEQVRVARPRQHYDAGLLLSDLDRPSRVEAARAVIGRIPTRWLVLTAAVRGPRWGALFDAGAVRVLSETARMDRVERNLRQLASGHGVTSVAEAQRLQRSWQRSVRAQQEVDARIASLTAREREVLALIDLGETTESIAGLLTVAPSTVRTQVKAVLRKLEVSSQLAAVAAYRSRTVREYPVQEDLEERPWIAGPGHDGRGAPHRGPQGYCHLI